MSFALSDIPNVPMSIKIEVSIVMPCLNEVVTVGLCVSKAIRALSEIGISGEVIVADNGSTDGSREAAERVGARVVLVSVKGYGAALQGGIAMASGRYVILGDSDDSYDFTRIQEFVERLHAGDDLVVGNRFKGGIRPGAMPWLHRYLGNPILTAILNLLYHSKVGDAHCGLRAFRKESYDCLGLKTPGMEFASEMIVKATLRGLRVSEVPVVLHPDGRQRRPHLRSFRDGWRHLRFLLLFCPLWLFLVPACLLMAFGLGLMIWLTPGLRVVGGIGLDVHTMLLGASCTLLGYQTLWLGLLAKVLGERVGVLPADPIAKAIACWLTVENGLILGGGLFAAGFGIDLLLTVEWWETSLGALDIGPHFRQALWGLAGMVMGLQTAYGSFFLGLIDLWSTPSGGRLFFGTRGQSADCHDASLTEMQAVKGPK